MDSGYMGIAADDSLALNVGLRAAAPLFVNFRCIAFMDGSAPLVTAGLAAQKNQKLRKP